MSRDLNIKMCVDFLRAHCTKYRNGENIIVDSIKVVDISYSISPETKTVFVYAYDELVGRPRKILETSINQFLSYIDGEDTIDVLISNATHYEDENDTALSEKIFRKIFEPETLTGVVEETLSVNLTKSDLCNLILGTTPSYDVMNTFPISIMGNYVGGFVDKWQWHYDLGGNVMELSLEKLWDVYCACDGRSNRRD